MVYDGPHAEFATLGGSPTWGLGEHFAEFAAARGYTRLGLFRQLTPYGRIPSYGQVADEDPQLRASEWKTFWILWKAGVRVLLVGGTSGSCDWRRSLADEDAVRPGDLVLPKSYLTRDTMPMGLPGTELEFCLTRQVAIMDDPFCPPLAETLRALAQPHAFRQLHGPEANVVLNRWLAGNGFESLATCRMLEVLGRQTGMPVITGDCVSPVLARVCGMHLAYYHVVANWGTGLEPEDPTISLDRLYVETLPTIAATLELAFLDTAPEPTACRCRELLRARPPEYTRALSPRAEA